MEKSENKIDPFAMVTVEIVNGQLNKYWTSGINDGDLLEQLTSIFNLFKNISVNSHLPQNLIENLQLCGWEQKLIMKLDGKSHVLFGQFDLKRKKT